MTAMASTFIPIVALCCYTFLLMTFLAAKKNRIIYSFIAILVASILWTGGSMLMRNQFLLGYEFWFQVSITGLFLLPFLFYYFIHSFIQAKGYLLGLLYGALLLAVIVLNFFGVFIKAPALSFSDAGQAVFTYHIGWAVLVPMVLTTMIIISMLVMIAKDVKKNEMSAGRLTPIVIGAVILFAGNVIIVIPAFASSTIDTLSGIINAGCMFYALYRQRLFKLTLLVSKGVIYMMSGLFVTVLFSNLITPLDLALQEGYTQFYPYKTLIVAVAFTVATILMYNLIRQMFDKILIRDELAQAQLLKQFSYNASRSLELDDILTELVQVVKDGVKVNKVYILVPDEEQQCYRTICSTSPLDSREFRMGFSNPCIAWLNTHSTCLMVPELQRTVLFKSMWELEKKQLFDLEIECLVPLQGESQLAGIIMLGKKHKNSHYTFDDIDFLESINSIVSIAIKNARLYEKAYLEARTDDLTGLLNRKYFHLALQEEFNRPSTNSLVLLILNIDDFKLYNQLYGNQDGDNALVNIAQIIKSGAGEKGIPARYSGKEFAVILPNQDILSAVNLAEKIRAQVGNLNKNGNNGVLKMLTLSAGICAYPYAASNVEQIITNADMAVYNAKRTGKDKVVVYSLKEPSHSTNQITPRIRSDVYAEYASTIYALTAAIDTKDHYTFHHSQNVAEYALQLSNAIGLNDEHIDMIREAALLHDIGKIGIPENILNKTGRLTEEEYEIMKKHVENSIAMIKHLPSLDYVIPGVIGHHERWDGKGYPRGISREDIPISARCLAIADAFDAMTTERSYRKPLPLETAVQEIQRQSGSQFDPTLVSIFVDLVEKNLISVDHSKKKIQNYPS